LPSTVSGWETDPLVAALYEKYEVPPPDLGDDVTLLARLMATDLRFQPASVTAPMIRIVAKLWMAAPTSDLAYRCYWAVEYLDCDCGPVDRDAEAALEGELENLTPLALPGSLVKALAGPLRSTLPRSQPRGH